jgi:hypothetical protein
MKEDATGKPSGATDGGKASAVSVDQDGKEADLYNLDLSTADKGGKRCGRTVGSDDQRRSLPTG